MISYEGRRKSKERDRRIVCRCFASLVGWSHSLTNSITIQISSLHTTYYPKNKKAKPNPKATKPPHSGPHTFTSTSDVRTNSTTLTITSHPTNISWQTGYATTTSKLPTARRNDRVARLRNEICLDSSHHFQGRGGMGRGGQRGGSSSQRGGGRHGGPQGPQPTLDKPKREAILDLAKYANARIRVKFTGGREGMSLSFYPNPADDDS